LVSAHHQSAVHPGPVKLAEVAEWNAGRDGIFEDSRRGDRVRWTVNRDFGITVLSGEEADVLLNLRNVALEFIT